MKKWKLDKYFKLGMLWTFLKMGISSAEYGIEKICTIMKQRLKQKHKIKNSKNIEEKQQESNQNHVHEATYARTLDNNSMVEAETCIEYSNQQINAMLRKSKFDLNDPQISEYELEQARLQNQILSYQQVQNMLKDRLAVTTNKEELIKLKQELAKTQFGIQDLLAKFNNPARYEEQSEKVKK